MHLEQKHQRRIVSCLRALMTASVVGIFGLGLPGCISEMSEAEEEANLQADARASADDIGVASSELTNATASTWGPAVVGVISTFSGSTMRCTGTFITRHDVLTAAHCIRDKETNEKASRVEVVFGGNWSGTRHRAFSWVSNPAWSRSQLFRNDIGMVSFASAIASESFGTTSWKMPEDSHIDRVVVMVCYGMASTDRASAGTKRWAYGRITENTGDTLTVTGHGEDRLTTTCDGDSGGPLLVNTSTGWKVVGVMIGGGNGCNPATGGNLYASMPSYWADFIRANTSVGVVVIP